MCLLKEKKVFVGVVVYISLWSDVVNKLRYSSILFNNVIGWLCKCDVFCCIIVIVLFVVLICW